MVRIAAALTGSRESGLRWLIDPHHRASSDELDDALTRYRQLLTALPGPPLGGVVSSLLHMHHNRALGVDRDSERACRHLARQSALSTFARSEDAP